jgi:transposase
VFVDETGHSFLARLGTTWAPVGQPPALRRVSKRRAVATIAGLVAPLHGPARLFARHFRGSVRWPQVLVALRHFRRRVGRPLVVVWDRLNAHRAKPVQAFVAAHPADDRLEWLPPYAPELNPEELCNGAVKRALRNAAPASVAELYRQARRGFVRLGRQPALLHSFFRHTGLPVTRIT